MRWRNEKEDDEAEEDEEEDNNNHYECDDDGKDDDEGARRSAAGRRRYFGGRANSVWSHPGFRTAVWGYWTLAIFFHSDRRRTWWPERTGTHRKRSQKASVARQGMHTQAGNPPTLRRVEEAGPS